MATDSAIAVTRDYYDSKEADDFYRVIWGGEDIHIGLYEQDRDVRAAARRTVDRMVNKLGTVAGRRVLDLGAGYGGAARVLAGLHGAHVTCLNLSKVENARNRALTRQAGLENSISVVDGSFDDLPFGDAAFDVVWSQDAILHAPDRVAVLDEIARVLKPGGALVFTDPMQADVLDDKSALQPIYDRIHLSDLASVAFYRAALIERGFAEASIEILTPHLRTHYARIAEEFAGRRTALKIGDAFVERMLAGLGHRVSGADSCQLTWGILHFKKAA